MTKQQLSVKYQNTGNKEHLHNGLSAREEPSETDIKVVLTLAIGEKVQKHHVPDPSQLLALRGTQWALFHHGV